jgi:hypothetical protein
LDHTAAGEWGAHRIRRKTFLLRAGLLLGGCLAGCTPLQLALKAYPSRFRDDPVLVDAYLRAFVATVIPGTPADDPNLVCIYTDIDYPFHAHYGFFVSDLARRSDSLFGDEDFPGLDPGRRIRVIRDGLDGDAIASRLYQGAIFMAQVSFYGSIYDDARGCPLIGYPGTESYHDPSDISYPDAAAHLSRESTNDGNYA